jgi:coenzyme F420-reducing hydrogenase delta subunit/ferredoxin
MSARARAYAGWQAVESGLDAAFGARANPLRRLGALGFLLFWIVAATGIYLYVFLDTSVAGAWRSVEDLGVMRSLHRYAADALVVVTLAHLAREWLTGHAGGFRWFSWLSGVPLVVLLYASGIGGLWLAWDRLALFSATATAEWFDWLGLTAEPFARTFLSGEQVVDRLFTLFIFLHLGIPLALLAGLWVHVKRISRPDSFPSRELAWGLLLALLALSLAWPVRSHAPAQPLQVPAAVALDWFYLFPNALMYATSPGTLWAMTAAALALLCAAPWLERRPRLPAAVVSPQDCNGCGRCFVDCPYSAITLVPHSAKRIAPRMAEVEPDLCAGCGLCAGACPSSTPFRSSATFASGIDLPGQPVAGLRADLERQLAGLAGAPRMVVFGCDRGPDVSALRSGDTVAMSLACAGMLPPSFVEFALRRGADGVLVTGCADGACEYRFGQRWLEERLAGEREPRLRANVARDRVRVAWAGSRAQLAERLAEFRAALPRKGTRA